MAHSIANCVRGSAIPGKWIEDVKNNVCGLDILLVGDSNCHYGEPANQTTTGLGSRAFGLGDGIAKVLIENGLNMYASPLYPVGIGSNTFLSGLGSRLISGNNRATAGTVGTGDIALRNLANTATHGYLGSVYNFSNGAFSGLEDFTFFYNEMSQNKLATATGSLKTGFYSHDPSGVGQPAATNWFMYTANSGNRSDNLVLDGTPWISASKWDNSIIYFRMTHSSTPNGGSNTITIAKDVGSGNSNAGSFNIALASPDAGATTNRFKDSEVSVNTYLVGGALPTASQIVINSGGVQVYFSPNTTFGSVVTRPFAQFFVSVYEKKIGFSVNLLQAEGQALPEDHINKFKEVDDAGNYIKQYFDAIVRRQKDASSANKGRVLIVFQAGTNTNATQGAFVPSTNSNDATNRVKNSFDRSIDLLRRRWTAAGYDANNLAFVVLGGPVTSNTFSDDISSKLFANEGANDVTAVDHVKSLPRTDYVSMALWDGGNALGTGSGTAATHLAEDGYIEWARAVFNNISTYYRKTFKTKKG